MSDFDSTLAGLGITRSANAAATSATSNASSTLDQADFLTLMTAQLKNQDPFAPVDNTQMIAQMAQFSSVAGISQMNTTLTSIAAKLNATSPSDALSYVGKTVLTAGDTAYPRTVGGIAGAVELGGAATDVNVTISDRSGNVLKTVALGAQPAGTTAYDWDGLDQGGQPTTGPYTVSVAAANNGATVASSSLVWAPVEAVSTPANGDPILSVTGLGSVPLSAVRSVG